MKLPEMLFKKLFRTSMNEIINLRFASATFGLARNTRQFIRGRQYGPLSLKLRRGTRKTLRGLRRVTGKILPALIMCGAGGLLAYGIVTAQPTKVIAILVGAAVCAGVARRLDLGIVLIVALSASFIHQSAIPKPFTIGGMGFELTELLLLFMLIVVFFRKAADRELDFFKSPLTIPLLLFCSAVVLSMFAAYQTYRLDPQGPFDFQRVYNTARPMFNYLLFLVVAFGIRSEREIKLILRILVWTAVVVSVLMVIQYYLGPSGKSVFISGAPGQSAYTQSLDNTREEADITRSTPPGLAIVVVFFLVVLTDAAYKGIRAGGVRIAAASILGIGLLFSFYRSFWISTFVSLLLIWVAANRTVKLRMSVLAVVGVTLTITGSIAVAKLTPGSAGRNFGQALAERFLSIFDPSKTLRSSSLENRLYENGLAIRRIKQSPIFGIGAGTVIQYRQSYNRWKNSYYIRPIRWIHNSYLELWLVYGLIGVVSFAWLSIAFLARSWLLFKYSRDPVHRSLAIAFFASYIGYLQRSITQMHITHDYFQMITVTLMWGIIEAIWRLQTKGVKQQDELVHAQSGDKSPASSFE